MTTRSRPVAIDLFCGAGGMSLGFERAGFDVLAAVDNDPVHLAVHARNFPHTKTVCADISHLTRVQVTHAIEEGWRMSGRSAQWDGTLDCIFGGPSCQGFSDMGKQAEDDARNDLIFAFARIVKMLKPKAFVIENVPGLMFEKARDRLRKLQDDLIAHGYTLSGELPVKMNAADYLVPQNRRRVFIIGSLDGTQVPCPAPSRTRVTVADALDGLPNVATFRTLISNDRLALKAGDVERLDAGASEYERQLRSISGFEYERVWDRTVLTGNRRTVHSAEVVKRFRALAPGAPDPVSRTSRLHPDGQAQTLRAGSAQDHGSYTAPRPVHHRYPRVITVREAARLHSFPDWFAFNVSKWHALREIGNSVPPNLARAVAASLADALSLPRIKPEDPIELGSNDLLNFSIGSAAAHYGLERSDLPPDVRRPSAPVPVPVLG